MKRQNVGIAILSVTATVLLIACVFLKNPQPAPGMVTIKERDYIICTSPLQKGGDALYITEVRSGNMVVFMYNPNTRNVEPAAPRFSLPAMFNK